MVSEAYIAALRRVQVSSYPHACCRLLAAGYCTRSRYCSTALPTSTAGHVILPQDRAGSPGQLLWGTRRRWPMARTAHGRSRADRCRGFSRSAFDELSSLTTTKWEIKVSTPILQTIFSFPLPRQPLPRDTFILKMQLFWVVPSQNGCGLTLLISPVNELILSPYKILEAKMEKLDVRALHFKVKH